MTTVVIILFTLISICVMIYGLSAIALAIGYIVFQVIRLCQLGVRFLDGKGRAGCWDW